MASAQLKHKPPHNCSGGKHAGMLLRTAGGGGPDDCTSGRSLLLRCSAITGRWTVQDRGLEMSVDGCGVRSTACAACHGDAVRTPERPERLWTGAGPRPCDRGDASEPYWSAAATARRRTSAATADVVVKSGVQALECVPVLPSGRRRGEDRRMGVSARRLRRKRSSRIGLSATASRLGAWVRRIAPGPGAAEARRGDSNPLEPSTCGSDRPGGRQDGERPAKHPLCMRRAPRVAVSPAQSPMDQPVPATPRHERLHPRGWPSREVIGSRRSGLTCCRVGAGRVTVRRGRCGRSSRADPPRLAGRRPRGRASTAAASATATWLVGGSFARASGATERHAQMSLAELPTHPESQ